MASMNGKPSTDSVWLQLGSALRRFIRRRVRDDHVADDLLQETFLRIHRNIAALEEADRLVPWVYQVARNVIHDHYRRGATHTALLDHDVAAEQDPLTDYRGCGAEWLDELVCELPDIYQEAVRLSEIDELPQQEVADRLGLSLPATKSRIQRGRAALKEALERCCNFHFDRRGNLMGIDPKPDRPVCKNCNDSNSDCSK
jgi:RNA polymerase sigma-70 factor (ECF subfamily)